MAKLEVCYRTEKGSQRIANEDSLLVTQLADFYVLAVADGLGGHAGGEVASKVALVEIEECLKASISRGMSPDAELVRTAITKANREIYMLSHENPEYAGMGSTLVLALVSHGKALIANVGDSRAYLIGEQAIQITRDHSLVRELMDAKVITNEEAAEYPGRNSVTRALGMDSEVVADFFEEELRDSVLLLCSDGLTSVVTDEEMRKTVVSTPDLELACSQLVAAANEKGNTDDISIILARKPRYGASWTSPTAFLSSSHLARRHASRHDSAPCSWQ